MKLKPIVASLFMLGLVTSPFAMGKAVAGTVDTRVAQAIVDQNSVSVPVSSANWLDRISIAGMGNVVGIWGNHDFPGSFTELSTSTDLYVNNLNLFVNADLNSWTKVNVNLFYDGDRKSVV